MKAAQIEEAVAIFAVDVAAAAVVAVRIEEEVLAVGAAAIAAMAANCLSRNMPLTAPTRILPQSQHHRRTVMFQRSFPASHWQNTKRLLRLRSWLRRNRLRR